MSSKRNDVLLKIGLVAAIVVLVLAIVSCALLMINVFGKNSGSSKAEDTSGTTENIDIDITTGDDIEADDTTDIEDQTSLPQDTEPVTDIPIDDMLTPGVEYIAFPAFCGNTSSELPEIISELYTLGIKSSYGYEYNEENEKYTIFDVDFTGCEIDGNYYIEKGSEVNITLSLGPADKGTKREKELMTIYFTFDDGPSAETDEVLAILDKYNIKATFFTIGHIAKARPGNLKKIYNAGHVIACHSYSHMINSNAEGYIYSSPEALEAEIRKWEKTITNILGVFPENSRIFRFPGGSSQVPESDRAAFKAKLTELGYRGYDWSFANCDAWPGGNVNHLPTEEYLRESFISTLKNAKNLTKISLMHDRIAESRAQLEEEIQYLIANGYVFDTLDHLSYSYYFTK